MSARLALLIDLERCFGCRSCEVACKQEHRLGPGAFRNRVLWRGGGAGGAPEHFTHLCQQCARPACLRACPVHPKAIDKDPRTGVVSVDAARCTGCGECVLACPYSAMGYDARTHRAVKCDLCAERRAQGLTTACASVCPARAIRLGERDGLLATAASTGRRARDHDDFLLGPATVYLERLRAAPAAGPVPAGAGGAGTRPLPGDAPAFPYGRPRAEAEPDRVVPGGCNLCFNCCTVNFHFRGEKLVRVTGNERDPVLGGRVCPKSQLTLQLYHNPHRLTRPLRRVGPRGAGRFEPVSWDEALDGIAAALGRVRERWGPEALALYVGTRTGMLTMLGYAKLFAQLWGTPNIEGTDPFCATGKNIAYELVQGRVGSGNSYTRADLGSAALYLYVGDNQAETRPVYFGMINDWRLEKGARMVVVDPRCSVTAAKADCWLPIRPGTDMALGLALVQHVFARGLHDAAFCEAHVLGWERWRDFIEARGYTPDWAASITGIAAADIRRLAEDVARADGCVIFASRGLNQHTNGVQTNRVFMFLAAVTGNWGRRGGAYFNMTAGLPVSVNAPAARRAAIRRPRIRRSPAGWTEAMSSGRPYPLRAMICCNNPLALWPDQARARAALAGLDLLVHVELFPNETSAWADWVLPAAAGIEKGEVGRSNDDRRVVWIDRLVDPPGEARADGWIWIELGKRLGFGDVLEERWKDPAVFWDEACIDNEFLRGVTQARLHAAPWRWVRYPVASEAAAEQETLYLEGTTAAGAPPGHRFPTPSGRLEFWTERQEADFAAMGLSALPEFYSEREQLVDLPYVALDLGDGEAGVISPFHKPATGASPGHIVAAGAQGPGARLRAAGFDTELVTGRPPAAHFHSWTHYFWQAQEMWPDPYCQMHPDKAASLGIHDGDRVRVETAHGWSEARAWVHEGIRPSAVYLPIGWGERQPYHPWRPVNFLTDASQRDPISDQTNLKTLLCRVRRA